MFRETRGRHSSSEKGPILFTSSVCMAGVVYRHLHQLLLVPASTLELENALQKHVGLEQDGHFCLQSVLLTLSRCQ